MISLLCVAWSIAHLDGSKNPENPVKFRDHLLGSVRSRQEAKQAKISARHSKFINPTEI